MCMTLKLAVVPKVLALIERWRFIKRFAKIPCGHIAGRRYLSLSLMSTSRQKAEPYLSFLVLIFWCSNNQHPYLNFLNYKICLLSVSWAKPDTNRKVFLWTILEMFVSLLDLLTGLGLVFFTSN